MVIRNCVYFLDVECSSCGGCEVDELKAQGFLTDNVEEACFLRGKDENGLYAVCMKCMGTKCC